MFGVNGPELLVLALLFLVLFGPDRLPEAAMQMARWFGRLRAMSDQATAEIRREFEGAIREAEAARAELERLTAEARAAASEVEREARGAYDEAERELKEGEGEAARGGTPAPALAARPEDEADRPEAAEEPTIAPPAKREAAS